MEWSSSVSVLGQVSTDGSPLALWLHSSAQYSVHRFSISRSSVRNFPERSWTVVAFPCFTVVKSFTSWYALLLLSFLRFSSISPHCSPIMTQIRGDSDYWSLPPLTILCWRTPLVITKHPEDGPGLARMHNTTARLIIFLWGSASDQEWTLPEHEVFQEQTLEVTTTCRWWPSTFIWKRIRKPKHTRLKFDLEKLRDCNVLESFQAVIGGTVAPLIIMNDEDTGMDSMITTFNTAVTEAVIEILGKPWVNCRNSWSVRQRERTEKEKIRIWRLWETKGSE